MNALSNSDREQRIADAFCPGAPIDEPALFAGRAHLVKDVMRTIRERGRHVLLYGERGVGKTSLANILARQAAREGWLGLESVTINADPTDTFTSLFRKVFREVLIASRVRTIGFSGKDELAIGSLADTLPSEITPDDVRLTLKLLDRKTLVVLDELDRLVNPGANALLANTIKTLSDHAIPTTLILVGVADSVHQLIAEHASIERALAQVRIPRMSIPELLEIVDKGMKRSELLVDGDARFDLVKLSQGLPHFTHLLAQHAAFAAVGDGRARVTAADVLRATEVAVRSAQETVSSAYFEATRSPPDHELMYAQVLLACTRAVTDEQGFFTASAVREPLSEIMRRPMSVRNFSRHLTEFCTPARGPVLKRVGASRNFRYRFVNPMLQAYVIQHALATGLDSRLPANADRYRTLPERVVRRPTGVRSTTRLGISVHIGINVLDDAVYPSAPSLRGCENDARAMQRLAASRGFHTTLLTGAEATSAQVLESISSASHQVGDEGILLLTFSGMGGSVPAGGALSGDEMDSDDETWCLYDRQLLDDELYHLWAMFSPEARILLVNDTSFPGYTVRGIRHIDRSLGARGDIASINPRVRSLTVLEAQAAFTATAPAYRALQWSLRDARIRSRLPSVLSLSAAQGWESAIEDGEHGLFTRSLLEVWADGAFQGSYVDFHAAIFHQLRDQQSPALLRIGAPNPEFERQRPFTI